ncbi:MAG TPA: TetR/AcrR family transcriptional regulator [Gemmatimonadales bacterium]|nr:TetR/AcrR family transcriptional regulator [Gemmatimonadales bacterium]
MSSGTRDRILAEASRLFHRQGYEATGVATILRAAGVNSGSLYHFFPGKEALLVGVLERHLTLLDATILDPAEDAESDPIERIFTLLEAYRRALLVTDCTRGCPVGNLALEVGNRTQVVQSLIDQYFAGWTGRVRRWLDQAGPRLPAGSDRVALSRLVLSVMEGGVMQARAAGSLDPFDASVAELRRHLTLLQEAASRERGEEPAALAPEAAGTGREEPTHTGKRAAWRAW